MIKLKGTFILLFLFTVLLSACNIWEAQGKLSPATIPNYDRFTHHKLNISFLHPQDWQGSVGINGAYVMQPGSAEQTVSVSVMTSGVQGLTSGMEPGVVTLETYKTFRLAQLTTEFLDPELQTKVEKAQLGNYPAYAITYTYHGTKDLEGSLEDFLSFVQETFAVIGGTVYKLTYSGPRKLQKQYQSQVQRILGSFRLLSKP